MNIYYTFIKSINLNILEEIANKYETYENDKPIIEYCLYVIQKKDKIFNNILLKNIQQENYIHSYQKYKHEIYLIQYGNYNKTSTYFLWDLIKIMDNMDKIQLFMKEDNNLIKYASSLKDHITRLINMTFYNILWRNYKKLYEYCEYSLKESLYNMTLDKFTKLYEHNRFFSYCFTDIDIILYKYNSIKKYLDHYIITNTILFLKKKINLDDIFQKYLYELITLNNNIGASSTYCIQFGYNIYPCNAGE
jgi:hypothetical protein